MLGLHCWAQKDMTHEIPWLDRGKKLCHNYYKRTYILKKAYQ